MLANDGRFRRKPQIFQKVRAYFRVMEIYAHFFCQQALAAVAVSISAFRKQGRKKDGNRFPYRAEISFFPSDIVQQRTARQKCGIDRLRKLVHQHLRASRRTNRMTLVRHGHREKQPYSRSLAEIRANAAKKNCRTLPIIILNRRVRDTFSPSADEPPRLSFPPKGKARQSRPPRGALPQAE